MAKVKVKTKYELKRTHTHARAQFRMLKESAFSGSFKLCNDRKKTSEITG